MASKRRLSRAILRANRAGRAAFIPYLAAGDPSLAATGSFLEVLREAGADIIELGVPFSDPIADGPVNQRAAERALAAGATLPGILEMVRGVRRTGLATPLVLFSYYNPVLRMGPAVFAQAARAAGVDGALIVDLPPEEAGAYRKAAGAAGLETVFLASPTTSEERLKLIARASTGFIYYVSRLGVTGARESLSQTLDEELTRIKRVAAKPVAVGFGISTPEQAACAARGADAVVVGSALVRLLEDAAPGQAAARIGESARALAAALVRGKTRGG
ncbi:MAG TPA: tryptophan synthase subunit alpha [Elusimicrobia bacterium]|nr:tryptophan synthase subunit alpha [Elusimicrobiota bacterium]